jgi:hypothetical protein
MVLGRLGIPIVLFYLLQRQNRISNEVLML